MTLPTRILCSLLVSGHFLAGLYLGLPSLILPPFVWLSLACGARWFADHQAECFDEAVDGGIDSGMLLAAHAIRDIHPEASNVIDALRKKVMHSGG